MIVANQLTTERQLYGESALKCTLRIRFILAMSRTLRTGGPQGNVRLNGIREDVVLQLHAMLLPVM